MKENEKTEVTAEVKKETAKTPAKKSSKAAAETKIKVFVPEPVKENKAPVTLTVIEPLGVSKESVKEEIIKEPVEIVINNEKAAISAEPEKKPEEINSIDLDPSLLVAAPKKDDYRKAKADESYYSMQFSNQASDFDPALSPVNATQKLYESSKESEKSSLKKEPVVSPFKPNQKYEPINQTKQFKDINDVIYDDRALPSVNENKDSKTLSKEESKKMDKAEKKEKRKFNSIKYWVMFSMLVNIIFFIIVIFLLNNDSFNIVDFFYNLFR